MSKENVKRYYDVPTEQELMNNFMQEVSDCANDELYEMYKALEKEFYECPYKEHKEKLKSKMEYIYDTMLVRKMKISRGYQIRKRKIPLFHRPSANDYILILLVLVAMILVKLTL